ncbi:ABC transporter, ATP-binding protein [Hoylesella oralis ATCC 33269]|uniref:ABC transporter, ATP-binding protein n=3 Tax=Hoylesella oralis TaxID=28134 RepID=E7RNV7_9BACT|nr:ABC transporter, ATP-binding protein [Hoylesella oralis ATCC 33269]EFZ37450.1 ABC transporter, ATP-binding protein [Hoylesella oralis ATCC 33269]
MILVIFLFGNTLYMIWILAFMKYRRILDIKRFNQSAGEQSKIIQLIQGMQEIKLNNCEKQKRWEWERIQVKLFKIGVKGLTIGQIQQTGSVFFTQSTSIIVSFIAAKAVVDGNMTLGMMMSLTYIIGQVSAPIGEFIGFAQSYQDAKISLERLNEIHRKRDEEFNITSKLNYLPEVRDIYFENVTFSYSGADRDYALEDVTLTIPQHKVTAIVGSSGSGKTTLVKLLQGFYSPNRGNIRIGSTPLKMINPHLWRSKTGSVMQESYIFSDTIAKNIAISTDEVNIERLRHAVQVANIQDFINDLPMAYDTKIGMEGSGISQGQRQRILIARAVYKDPEYIFLDEATNSLDANNEKIIMDNLQEFYKGRTVFIVAHRLSTVRNADNIIVLEKGKIVEQGTHEELTIKHGAYYTLVKNQLELGK